MSFFNIHALLNDKIEIDFTEKRCYLIVSCKNIIIFHDVICKYLMFNLVHFQNGADYLSFLTKMALKNIIS
jgi:hypothetical protein